MLDIILIIAVSFGAGLLVGSKKVREYLGL